MSRKVCLFVALAILVSLAVMPGVSAAQNCKVKVDGELVAFSTQPFIESGRTLVPLEGLFEKLGAQEKWNSGENKILIEDKYTCIELAVDSKTAYILRKYDLSGSREKKELDVAPKLIDGKVFVPLRFVAETLGAAVDWDEEHQTAIIETKEAHVETPVAYKVLTFDDIDDIEELSQWYEDSRKNKGIYYKHINDRLYVLVCAGEKNTAGYSVDILNVVSVKADEAYVYAEVKGPGPDAVTAQVITYPYALIEIDDVNIKHVGGDVMDEPADCKTINEAGAAISPEDIKSIELYSLQQEKLKDYSRDEIEELAGYYNSSRITEQPFIQMIAGNMMVISFNNGGKINITSYGSKTNIVASGEVDSKYITYHLICPEIAKILLEK